MPSRSYARVSVLLACATLVLACACARAPEPAAPVAPPWAPPPAPSAAPLRPAPPPSPRVETAARDWYTRDVWVVERPPSAIFLLSRFTEPAGDGCEESLLAHARGLGANRLFIDRAQPCSGAAYMVRDPGDQRQRPDRSAGLSISRATDRESVAAWVRSRWRRPASITAEEAERLCVVVRFSVSPMRRVFEVRGEPIQSSGSRAFDESVRASLEAAIDEHAQVPPPPRDLVGEYIEYRVEVSGGDSGCRTR